MAARIGGIALVGVLAVGLYLGSQAMSSPSALFDVMAGSNRNLYAVGVGIFAAAAIVAISTGSGILRALGSVVLMGCFSFGVMLWSTWNTSGELAEAFEMIDGIDEQFAEVAAALNGVEANLAATTGSTVRLVPAQPTIDGLVLDGHVLVGRQCGLNQLGTGRVDLAYLSSGNNPELVQLTVEVIRGEPTVVLAQSTTTGSAPLLPVEPACF